MGEHPSADEDFHRLIDSIYESALDVTAMPAALDLFSSYTDTDSPHYLVWDKLSGQARLGVTPHGCFSAQGTYVPEGLHALASLPKRALAGDHPGDLQDGASWRAPAHGADLEHGIRLLDTAEVCVLMGGTGRGGRLDTSSDGTQGLSHRSKRLARVLPHWARAARMQQRNFELSGLAALGLAGLDTLDFGVMVLQADMRVRYANIWAEALVQADSQLALENGVFKAHDQTLHATLHKLLDRAMQSRGGEAAAGSWMHITSGGQPVPIIVLPLVARQPVEGPWQLPFAMVLMGNSESRSVLDSSVLTSLFGLSRKESLVAIRLAAGETLAEIADHEFVSPHTVRVHIRDILRKTGTHRQSELVRLLHLLPGVALERAGAARGGHTPA
ncbi:helix-turn-helix transcriptional regulator [Cupriavidus sp. CV2]|uniref:helix-turn-helix transcriptional regulator n=1 Tax=Cupriavidus ulmosensis TaxID=3065913 RepID=UPI00296A9BA1|nr:helix-turn-helix transcriptional regulator [Cupriavidus sp. CV2]MDW3685678.1 helix-turn-helix transcriptional regulator [Cupriavidus sp. CV2]